MDILSKNFTTFPISTTRNTAFPNGRMLSEHNLSTLIQCLTDEDKFVVNANVNDNRASVSFMMKGHFFQINNIDISSADNLYAIATFSESNEITISDKLQPENPSSADTPTPTSSGDSNPDSTSTTTNVNNSLVNSGIQLVSTEPSKPENAYYLHLLTKESGNWEIPSESTFKFHSSSIKAIDGGTI